MEDIDFFENLSKLIQTVVASANMLFLQLIIKVSYQS